MAESADIAFLVAWMEVIMPPSQSTMNEPEEKGHDLSRPLFLAISTEIRLKIYEQVYKDVVC
jgi:hypothetical protein